MKKLFVLITFLLVTAGLAVAAESAATSVTGTWKYSVTNAPDGVNTGELIFAEAQGKITGKAVFANGNSAEITNIKVTGNELTFGLYVESYWVSAKAKVEGIKMAGQVQTPDGPMDFTAEKVVKK